MRQARLLRHAAQRPPLAQVRPLYLLACFLLVHPGCEYQPSDDGPGANDDDSAEDSWEDDDDSAGNLSDDDDTTNEIPKALHCIPPSQTVSNTWGTPLEIQLEVHEEDWQGNIAPASEVVWALLSGGGSVDPSGLYTSSGENGGRVEIQAQVVSETVVCEILVDVQGLIDDSGDPDFAPAADAATVGVDDSCAAAFTYPLAAAVMPGSFPPPLIQWDPGPHNAHVLTLESQHTSIEVLSFASSWQVPEAQWRSLTRWDPASTVSMSLASGTWTGSALEEALCSSSDPLELTVTDFELDGTVIYWRASWNQGLKRIDFGGTTSSDFPVSGGVASHCVGCHGVNLANPGRLAVGEQNVLGPAVFVVDALDPETPVVASSPDRIGRAGALNPAGTRMVRSTSGTLTLDDVSSGGAPIATVPTPDQGAAFPNWSPDGSTLVYSSCANGAEETFTQTCSIRALEVLPGDQWGDDQVLVAFDEEDNINNYYPVVSPDSGWVLYNRGLFNSYNNPAGELWIVPIAGGDPVALDNATAAGWRNSWPRWSPDQGQEYAWFAFTTDRPYGDVSPQHSQIWLAALDLEAVAAGDDGSFAPVWLPGQSTSERNYIPVWVSRL